ncbi:uncharacterized protein LOC129198610 [Grus americana]|uniref:uncharacterized protein LOC129198610 n=1 Tax=Grus americana TaxID=9117 RepID=UPI002408629E|nr:uncharacterized protein LOC129198610 [Grus americana]
MFSGEHLRSPAGREHGSPSSRGEAAFCESNWRRETKHSEKTRRTARPFVGKLDDREKAKQELRRPTVRPLDYGNRAMRCRGFWPRNVLPLSPSESRLPPNPLNLKGRSRATFTEDGRCPGAFAIRRSPAVGLGSSTRDGARLPGRWPSRLKTRRLTKLGEAAARCNSSHGATCSSAGFVRNVNFRQRNASSDTRDFSGLAQRVGVCL